MLWPVFRVLWSLSRARICPCAESGGRPAFTPINACKLRLSCIRLELLLYKALLCVQGAVEPIKGQDILLWQVRRVVNIHTHTPIWAEAVLAFTLNCCCTKLCSLYRVLWSLSRNRAGGWSTSMRTSLHFAPLSARMHSWTNSEMKLWPVSGCSEAT